MTKGELISSCLKVMFDTDGDIVDSENISNNAKYQDRISVMIESINRALFRVETLEKLPRKSFVIDFNTIYDENNGNKVLYNLNAIIGDINIIDHVDFYDKNNDTLFKDIEYKTLGLNKIVLPILNEVGKTYIVHYRPKAERLKYSDSDSKELETPENILSIIPYFVKGDLYEEDNANISLYNRDLFETYLSQIPIQEYDSPRKIRVKYGY